MFSSTFRQFSALRPPVRALVFLFWIYDFTGGMVGVFTQIFLYQRFTSLELNIIATIVFYTGIMVGFVIPGIFATYLQLNIKRGFAWSFLFLGLSLLYLLSITDTWHAHVAMFFWGFGQGVFWLTVNTFELSETKNEERDSYASALNAGTQVLGLAGPAAATALLWISSSVLHLGTYTLLFTVAPAIYLLGFFCFSSIADYRPPRIRWEDIRYYFTDRKNQAAQLYTFGTGIQQTLGVIIMPLVTLAILGTALRVGVYNTLFAVLSALCVLAVAQYRTPKNRLFIYGITVFGVAAAVVWLGYAFTFLALAIYTVVDATFSPVMGVTAHVVDLSAMEVGRSDTDFYATMILRDFFLWVWRSIGGLVLLVLVALAGGLESRSLSFGLYALAVAFGVTYFGAYLFTRLHHSVVL